MEVNNNFITNNNNNPSNSYNPFINENYSKTFFMNNNSQNKSGINNNNQNTNPYMENLNKTSFIDYNRMNNSINYNKINNNSININNNNIINIINHSNSINNINNNTNKIKDLLNSNKNLSLSKKSISSTNSQKTRSLKSKKIKIDFSKKINQDIILSILENIIKCEKEYNSNLNSKEKISLRNYSPCYIISKTFINNIKQLFNYDYYKSYNNFNANLILNQRNNNPYIYIDELERITIDDFKNNNIILLNEISYKLLFSIDHNLEKDNTKYKECEIYLKNERGIILVNEDNINYLFVFEVNNSDINQIKNYDLINFKENENEYNDIIAKLKKENNMTDEIWNKIINFSNNCNFIIDKNSDINSNINKLMNKINNYKNYFENNKNIQSTVFYEKLEGYQKSLNLYEQILNEKEKHIKNSENLLKNNNMKNYNNMNNNFNNMNNFKNNNIYNYNNINNNNNMNNFNNVINMINSFNNRSTYNYNNNYDNIENKLVFSTMRIPNNNNNNFNNNFNNNNNNYNYNNNNNNYNNNYNNGKVKINRNYPSLGLANIGSTCYMNATIQCLAHIPELSEELIQIYNNNKRNNNNFINYIQNNKLTKEYTLLLINIFFPRNNQKYYAPYELKKIIGSQESLFSENDAEDAKDLLIFLIETMNTELNGGISPIYNDIVRLGIDQKDQLKIKLTFLNDFNSKNFSIFSKIFYGFSQTCNLCLRCQTKRYNYECFNLLIFQLLEIKNYVFKTYNNYNYNQYTLSLKDCFDYYNKLESFSGDNQIYCNECKSNQNCFVQRMIDQAPQVLIIILDRGLNNMDFKEWFNYDEYLNIGDYVPNNTISQYYLCGVIVHMGESGPGGHFVAFCKMDSNSPWYFYNDSIVSQCNDIRDIFNNGTPYILFYHYFN